MYLELRVLFGLKRQLVDDEPRCPMVERRRIIKMLYELQSTLDIPTGRAAKAVLKLSSIAPPSPGVPDFIWVQDVEDIVRDMLIDANRFLRFVEFMERHGFSDPDRAGRLAPTIPSRRRFKRAVCPVTTIADRP